MSKLDFTAIKLNRFRFVFFPILLLTIGFVFAAQLSSVKSENNQKLNQTQNELVSKQASKQASKQYNFAIIVTESDT